MVTMRTWLEHSLDNFRLASRLLDNSTILRNEITALFSKVMHHFDKEIHETDYAYRKRYQDTLMAARRLEHNRQNVRFNTLLSFIFIERQIGEKLHFSNMAIIYLKSMIGSSLIPKVDLQ